MNWIAMSLILLPFSVLGLYKIVQVIYEQARIKKGYYKIERVLPNGRLMKKWIKPDVKTGKMIKLGDEHLPFDDSTAAIFYEGKIPKVIYVGDQQVIKGQGSQTKAGELSSLFSRVYNLGKLQGNTDTKLMFYAIIGCLVVSVITLLLFFKFTGTFDTQIEGIRATLNTIKMTI